ncbi:MAG TPA: hypothetical protein VF069_17415 [Streptosporangiaceae bacterium]
MRANAAVMAGVAGLFLVTTTSGAAATTTAPPAHPPAAVAAAPASADAIGYGLWHCTPFDPLYDYACTTIIDAPATGVQVLDRNTGVIRSLHNGDSVALVAWAKDSSGKCGIHGDSYVWKIAWVAGQVDRMAFIGDYYLNTGSVDNWNFYPDYWGTLGDNDHYIGTGHGTCDVFPSG